MYLSYEVMSKMEEVTVGLICSHNRHSITLRRHGPVTLHDHSKYERSHDVLAAGKALHAKPSPCIQVLLAFQCDARFSDWLNVNVSQYVRRVCQGFRHQLLYNQWSSLKQRHKEAPYDSEADKSARKWMRHYTEMSTRRSHACFTTSTNIAASKHNLFRRFHTGKGLQLEGWDVGKLTAASIDAYGPNPILPESAYQRIYTSIRGEDNKFKYATFRSYDLSDRNLPRCIYGNLSERLGAVTGDELADLIPTLETELGR